MTASPLGWTRAPTGRCSRDQARRSRTSDDHSRSRPVRPAPLRHPAVGSGGPARVRPRQPARRQPRQCRGARVHAHRAGLRGGRARCDRRHRRRHARDRGRPRGAGLDDACGPSGRRREARARARRGAELHRVLGWPRCPPRDGLALDLSPRQARWARGTRTPKGGPAPRLCGAAAAPVARGRARGARLRERAHDPRRARAAGRPLYAGGRRRPPRKRVRDAAPVGPHGRAPLRRADHALSRPRHNLGRHRARRDPGSGRRSADHPPGRSAVHRRLHEGRDRLLVRHRARRAGQARAIAPVPRGHRGRGTPPAPRSRRSPRDRVQRGDRMSMEKELHEYTAKTVRSRALHEEALAVMPGGNSRTTTFFDPYPFYIQRGQGAHIWDADGNDRLDFNGNYTSLILGHAPPEVVKAIQEAVVHGLSFPGPTEHEVRLAEGLPRRAPPVERIRFTNSGPDGAMNDVRRRRGLTGRRLRALTERHGIVLIFDEVISFRIAWGGAQERYGVRPDLTTFGKIIGGGLPVGAFGGRADIMSAYDPRKGAARISHGGTFNANPATMAAGVATLNALTPEAYARLDALGERLRGGVTRLLAATRRKGQVSGVGSLFCLHWAPEPLTDHPSSRPNDPEAPMRLFMGLLNEGILLTQRGLGACSLAMTDEDIDRFVNALARVLARG